MQVSKKLALWALLAVNFSGSVGFSLVIPFLAILVTRFGGNAIMYGVVGALYSLFQFISAPILGKLSDTYGRKPLLFISQLGTLIGWIVFSIGLFLPIQPLVHIGLITLTIPLVVIILGRVIDGSTGGNIAIAQAYLADITSDNERSKSYGLLSLSQNIGFVIGPALAGILASTFLQEKLPVFFAILVSLVALLLIQYFLPESHKKSTSPTAKISFWKVLQNKEIVYILAMYFFIYLGFSFFYTSFPIYAVTNLLWTVGRMGIFFSFLSLSMAIVQGPVLSFATKHTRDTWLISIGLLLLVGNFVLLTFHSDWILYTAAILFALGNGIMWPSLLSLLSKVAGSNMQGTVQGMSGSLGSLASVAGLLLGGVLFQIIGKGTFFVSGATMLIIFLLSLRLFALDKKR